MIRNILLSLVLLSGVFGCKKPSNSSPAKEYYVKYIIDGGSSIQQVNTTGLKVTLKNEKGVLTEYIRSNRGSNEFIVGPVTKGFVCSVKGTNVCCPQCCYIRPNLQIYTSENNGPFVLKKEDLIKDLRDEAEIVYTVE